MLCISPTFASSASFPTTLRSGIDTTMFLPLLIVGKAFSYITGSKRPIKEQRKSKPGEDFHWHRVSSEGFVHGTYRVYTEVASVEEIVLPRVCLFVLLVQYRL